MEDSSGLEPLSREELRRGVKALVRDLSGITLAFLGGLGKIGRNCLVIEQGSTRLVVDCGVMFLPQEKRYRAKLPMLQYFWNSPTKDTYYLFTHAHEDHIGALPYLYKDSPGLALGSAFTLGLLGEKMAELGIEGFARREVKDFEILKLGPFFVEFLPITHSVPQSLSLAVYSSEGVLFHTGDFKLDPTPVDRRLSALERLGEISRDFGIELMMSDSTNAENGGWSESESVIQEVFEKVFSVFRDKRIVITCFSSHVHRIQQAIWTAVKAGRRVALLGRSIQRSFKIARRLNLLDLAGVQLVDPGMISELPAASLCVICTGSQGEELSTLWQLARGENQFFEVGEEDVVVVSSSVVPGNELQVGEMLDGLARRGAKLIYHPLERVHVSGHAHREELRHLISIASPRRFIPVHGEFRYLTLHKDLAIEAGVDPAMAMVCEDGQVLSLKGGEIREVGLLNYDPLFIDLDGEILEGKEEEAQQLKPSATFQG